ncbi:MAG: TonB-dependent receptor [Niabella sp.]
MHVKSKLNIQRQKGSLLLMLFIVFSSAVSAQVIVKGVVTNSNGVGIPGVTVTVSGTNNGTITGDIGMYTIKAGKGDKLVFSSIGFVTQEAVVGDNTEINIRLADESAKSMNEIVVVGYGAKKRADITGAVASVPKERLSQLPVTNILHAVEGSTPGVNITQTSSVPGSTGSVLIRGQNSMSAGTSPYIIVDGVPLTGSGGGTNDINPNDIASIDILKDASATAIYGVNGANGVILITTKRGITGKPVIRYNGYGGFDNIAHLLKPLSPEGYVQKYADWYEQVNGTAPEDILPNAYEIANYNEGKTVDWLDEVTQQGVMQDHNLSVSGGSKDIKYFLSGDYLKQKGAVKGYQYHRASLRSNLDVNVTNFLTLGTSLSYAANNYDGGRANFYLAGAMSPYGTLYDENGDYEIYPMYPELLYANPLLGLYTDRVDRSNNLTGNGYAEVKFSGILSGLKYRLNGSYTNIATRTGGYTGRDANSTIGSAYVSSSETNSWLLENILTYEKNWKLHHLDFTGLYSAKERNYFYMGATATGFFNDELSFNELSAGSTQTSDSYRDRYGLLSQMARINYGYDSRYLLTLTGRRDGASVMGANTSKYGFFPSAAFAWNISREAFMQNISKINNLKLRLSYGRSGNEAISVYQTISTSSSVMFPYNGETTIGVVSSVMGNGDLHWESITTLNLGLDFGVLNDRINGSVDIYKGRSKDLLMKRSLPNITGYTYVWDNLGKTSNSGIEISLNTQNVAKPDFKWNSNIVFASNKNKIIDIYGDKQDDVGNLLFIGQPIGVIYDYKMLGVWQEGEDRSTVDATAADGDLKFYDKNGDGSITADDKMVLGQTAPKWTGGLTNTFQYKNLRLSVFIQTVQGALKNNITLTYADEAGRMNIPADVGYWTAENKSNTRPSLAYTNTRGYGYASDNSYTRIKDVTLSYTFSQKLLDRLKLGSVTLYASGRNLHTFTKWIGWDPENNYSFRGSGDWTNNYPLTRSIVFGANVTLR